MPEQPNEIRELREENNNLQKANLCLQKQITDKKEGPLNSARSHTL